MEVEPGNYYAVLNVSPDASEEDIRVAYKRLCVIFHPDKHTSVADRKAADVAFRRVRAAYEVLSNAESRALYDVFGNKAMETNMQIVPSGKHVREFKSEYERLWRMDKNLKKLHQLAPATSLQIGYDLTSTELDSPGRRITQVAVSQSKQYRIADSFDMSTTVSVASQNGVGIANLALDFRRLLGAKWRMSTTVNLNNLMFHPLDTRPRMGPVCEFCTNPLEPDDRLGHVGIAVNIPRLRPSHLSLSFNLQHQVSPSISQVIELGGVSATRILPSEVGYALTYKRHPLQLAASFSIGRFNRMISLQSRYTIGGFELRGSCRMSVIESFSLNYGVSKFAVDGMSVSGFTIHLSPSLVSMTFRFQIGKHRFTVPITVSQSICWSTLFYSNFVPLALGFTYEQVLSRPIAWIKTLIDYGGVDVNNKSRRRSDGEEKDVVMENMRRAERETELMKSHADRAAKEERSRNGLVIQRAWYGVFEENEEYPKLSDVCFSVATQLQICVVNSKLILHQGQSKSQLSGFFDPCPGETKRLKIVYMFKGELHESVFGDLDPVRLPKMSHRVETT